MARAVCCNGPWSCIGIRDGKQYSSHLIQKLKGVTFFEASGVWAQDVGDPVNGLNVLKIGRNYHESSTLDNRPAGKSVTESGPNQSITTDVMEPGIGVID